MRTTYALCILLPTMLMASPDAKARSAEPDCRSEIQIVEIPAAPMLRQRDRLFVRSLLRARPTTYDNRKRYDDKVIRDLGLLLNGRTPASSFA